MPDRAVGLDNAAFTGRLRQGRPSFAVPRARPQPQQPVIMDGGIQTNVQPTPFDVVEQSAEPVTAPEPQSLPIVQAQPFAQPAVERTQPSKVLQRPAAYAQQAATSEPVHVQDSAQPEPPQDLPSSNDAAVTSGSGDESVKQSNSLLLKSLFGIACLVFVVGLGVSWQTQQTNRSAVAQLATLSEEVQDQNESAAAAQRTAPVLAQAEPAVYAQHAAALDAPRYVQIPKLKVDAPVVGVDKNQQNNSLQYPSTMYEAGWYAASAKPGQPGVTLMYSRGIVGNKKGPLTDAANLAPGDFMTIVRGDNTKLQYKVTGSQFLNATQAALDMAMTPARPDGNFLHILTTAPGTDRQVVVFAEQQ